MRARTLAGALATLAVSTGVAIPAFATSAAHTASGHTVILKHSKYTPGTLTIKRGDSVTWQWRDGKVQHNVVASGFRSKVQSSGTFTVRFTRSGSFSYRCTIHPHMSGKILVK